MPEWVLKVKYPPLRGARTAVTAGRYFVTAGKYIRKAGKYIREIILNAFEICYDIFVRNNEPFTSICSITDR